VIKALTDRYSKIEWGLVQNATHYSINIGDERFYTDETSINLSELDLTAGLKNFKVVAHVLGASSSTSPTLTEFYGYEIILPELPLRVCIVCSNSSFSKTYEITSITNNFSTTIVRFFFTGRLIESASGPNTAVSGTIQYRILDDEDYTINSNGFNIGSIFPNEGFRSQNSFWVTDRTNSPYGIYRLDIISIQN
jgi:hypothetical protein